MFDSFIRAAKGSYVWFVTQHAVIKGTLATFVSFADNITTLKLTDVTIVQGGGETEVPELIVPTLQISSWGTDEPSFDHLSPNRRYDD